ncbi:MAG: endonuclease III [Desulfobacteraceae bacterium 4484_190.3]|nr:MAG: endonuclease III [Desulfobacteraceae bacterium 4484_190.3]
MNDNDIATVVDLLVKELKAEKLPIVSDLAEKDSDPFQILISTLLSLRTKDEVTEIATKRLFALASAPSEMLKLSENQIIDAIYPVGFYKNKTRTILHICRELIEKHKSRVPDTIDGLLSLKGVGRKTANLVVTLGYQGDGICVDTHVHRISNRLGYVKTKNPGETEFALRKKLPHQYWIIYNTIMVAFGRNICRPVSPICSKCPVSDYCEKAGVTRSR